MPKPPKGRKLTAKQEAFVIEYLKDRNATRACIRAGYSPRNADKIGPELLGKTRVSEAIAAKTEKVAKKAEITAEMVLSGLKREAEYDGEGASHGARVSAWGKLGDHLGLFPTRTKHEHTGPDGGPIQHDVRLMTEEQLRSIIASD